MNTDKRALNRMRPETLVIHVRLETWAKWSSENHGGWPVRTLLGRVIEEGCHGAPTSRPPISMPDAIWITDRAVGRLRSDDQIVIHHYYKHWEPIEVTAERLALSLSRFRTRLDRARTLLVGLIEGMESEPHHKTVNKFEASYKS